ncbi:MAG: hypothetical protein CMP66_07195 [Flavobacteriales bacterium]|nr:hypothetical protein [Flavobacteriales bacterium]
MKQKRHIVMLLTIASILLAPLIAMQFSTEVQWTAGDFIIAAILLSSFALLIEFLIRKKQQGKRRTVLILLAILTFLLLWGEMAVGLL